MELHPYLQRTGEQPLYVQLYRYIKEQMETGMITAGDGLPSIRLLAQQLAISRNTVEAAYQQLIAEGYVTSKPKSGLLVAPLETEWGQLSRPQQKPLLSLNISVKKQIDTWRYDFHYGHIELDRFPLKAWRKRINEVLDYQSQDIFLYGDPQGERDLREQIASYLFQARDVTCCPEQIIMCAGAQQAISLICQLLGADRLGVAVENPGYDGVRAVFARSGCDILPIPLEEDGIDLDKLERSGAKLAYITPSHQLPLGMVLPIQKRLRLLAWAERHESLVIEDDYDSEYRYQGHPIPSLKGLDTRERVIYMGTFSKSFLPAVRISYLVLPSWLIERFYQSFPVYSQPCSPIIQSALARFMKYGDFERHVRKMRTIYQRKHQTLLSAIDTHMGEKVEVIGSRAGLHILLKVQGMTRQELIRKARAWGVNVDSPERYWIDPAQCPDGLLILGFGGLSEKEIGEGIATLAKAWFGRMH
ncbi:PLP-dependent aminotransferase family protein [Brevibacillus humidisoli]|uniref:MocR-like pyridoxine biosynthesis transcription factor PdxR n=1 Tax=Brevibacillus humidisoli TaxID=2895522 RepID=UPI001E4555B4|nr:PLP-dependent aminotransferase family protein [Brevibacillus humidisoli]UFJ42289.1 PLP-dependent aminotransferase family protein [Brevibacillus humidisoli]